MPLTVEEAGAGARNGRRQAVRDLRDLLRAIEEIANRRALRFVCEKSGFRVAALQENKAKRGIKIRD
jgi:hypothetical protein